MSEDNRSLNFLSLAAVIIAVVALAVGAVLPSTGDIMFNELYGVGITDSVDGQILKYDAASGNWINVNETQVVIPTYGFSNLTDSGISSPLINQTLVYNGVKWVNQNQPEPFTVDGWEDLNFPALSLAKSASAAPNQGVIFASGLIEGLLFNGDTLVNEVYGSGEILHSYDEGTDLYPHVHWMATDASIGNVTWYLEYNIANDDGVYGAPIIVSATQVTTGVAWVNQITEFSAINGTGLSLESQIAFRLYRNATSPSDTYSSEVALLSFGIHYQLDSVGSSLRSAK
jgi:hypothetical protein